MAEQEGERASKRAATAKDPDDPRKPDELTEITRPSWRYIGLKTMREFTADQATDLAAALTYYGVLAIFPALLAFVSLIGLFGDPTKTTGAILDLAAGLVPQSTLDAVSEPIAELAASPAAGWAFVIGVVGAIWSASGYVGAFSRAMNRIYSIQEGRPFWKLRPIQLVVTIVAILTAVFAALLVALSGPIADQVGAALGLGETVLVVWNIIKWPILAFLAVLVIALLYYATPNIRQPKFRWMSLGALLALVTWVLASAGFGFYAANFSSYNSTYGSIGGIIVFLLWVWISNIALLFGAELDAELERGRELQAGIKAEETIQLPPRDTRQSDKVHRQQEKDVRKGKELRARATGNPVEDLDRIDAENAARAPRAKDSKKFRKEMKKQGKRNRRFAKLF